MASLPVFRRSSGDRGLSNTANPEGLKQRVEARDRLTLVAEHARQTLATQFSEALARGDIDQARSLLGDSEAHITELAESLRTYQAELHAQADELAASQARTDRALTRFTTLFAHMPVAALTVGPRGDVLDFNARADLLFGLSDRFAPGRFLHRLVQTEAYQSRVRPAMLAAQEGDPVTLDAVDLVDGDGRRFIGELHVAWLPSDEEESDGLTGHHVCAIVDRTEALQALQALRASEAAVREREALLAQTARLARVGGWALALQPQQAWQATAQLRELLDLSPDETLSLALLLGCCGGADRLRLSQALQRAAEGEAFALELDLVTPSGRPLRAAVSGQPERAAFRNGSDGPVQRVVGLLQDITRSHEDQRRIGELAERLALVNEAGGVGGWHWNLTTDEVEIDERMARLLDLPAGGPLTAPQLRQALDAVLPPDEAERLDTALLTAVQRGGAVNLELRRRPRADTAAGAPAAAWLHITGRAHADGSGRVLGIVGCAWEHHTHDPATRR
jgi:PAS domain S-box-containing protein